MCCLVALAGLVSPRLVLVLWWLVDPARWSALFDNLIVPVLGFLFLPWTTLVYVFFAPTGFGGPGADRGRDRGPDRCRNVRRWRLRQSAARAARLSGSGCRRPSVPRRGAAG